MPKPVPKKRPKTFKQRQASARKAVAYRKVVIAGVPCHVVQIDLNNPNIRLRPVRATDLGTTYRTFGSFVRRSQPLAAITGTFFDTASGKIVSNLVRDGQLLESGGVGSTFSLDSHNSPRWFATAGIAGGRFNWSRSEFAVSSGPTLVRKGQVCLDPASEGFSDPGLFRMASRAGLATTRKGKLLFVSVNHHITLGRFAEVMRKLGAENALNLDGGSSTGLYAKGRFMSRPQRNLTNVLMVSIRP